MVLRLKKVLTTPRLHHFERALNDKLKLCDDFETEIVGPENKNKDNDSKCAPSEYELQTYAGGVHFWTYSTI